MKILTIALLGASLLASGAVAAKQPVHLPDNANQYYGLFQGPSRGVAPSRLTDRPELQTVDTIPDPLHQQLFTVGH
jgi:hypothetical protein